MMSTAIVCGTAQGCVIYFKEGLGSMAPWLHGLVPISSVGTDVFISAVCKVVIV